MFSEPKAKYGKKVMNVYEAPVEESGMKHKTNFDRYLEEHLKDPDFAERFRKAADAWDEVIQESNARDTKKCAKSQGQESRI